MVIGTESASKKKKKTAPVNHHDTYCSYRTGLKSLALLKSLSLPFLPIQECLSSYRSFIHLFIVHSGASLEDMLHPVLRYFCHSTMVTK